MKTWTIEVWRRDTWNGTFTFRRNDEIEARTESSAMKKAEKMTNPYQRVYVKGEKK